MGPDRYAASLAVVALLCPMTAQAQKTTFDPSIFVSYATIQNVDLIGVSERDDETVRLGVELPVRRQLRKGRLDFTYRPMFEDYQRFDELDNVSHRLLLGVHTAPTRLSEFGIELGYLKSIQQGDARSLEDEDLFLSQRTDRRAARASLEYRNRLRGRWAWAFSGGFSEARFKEIPDFDTGTPARGVEGRTTTLGSFTLYREVSRQSEIGLRYEVRRFDLEQSGRETTHIASFVWNKEFSRRSAVELLFGGFESTGTAARGAQGDSADSRRGLALNLELSHALKQVTLRLFGRVEPTAGGARPGTSTNQLLGFSVGSRETRVWSWSSGVRWARRDSSDPRIVDVEAVSAGLTVDARFLRFASLRLSMNYITQSGEDERLELLSDGGLSLVWYPLAGMKISGRGREGRFGSRR